LCFVDCQSPRRGEKERGGEERRERRERRGEENVL
jgi:hypothetical protein